MLRAVVDQYPMLALNINIARVLALQFEVAGAV